MFANSSYRLGKLGGEARRNGGQALSIEGRSKWETGSKSIRSCTKSLRIFEMEVPCCECSGMHHVMEPEPAGNGRLPSIPARYGEKFAEIGTIRYRSSTRHKASCSAAHLRYRTCMKETSLCRNSDAGSSQPHACQRVV